MNFHEIRISPNISYGASGGPQRKTEIVELASGHEERNSPWSESRRQYDISYGAKSVDDVHEILSFFETREGSLYGFRYKDWSDYKTVAPLQTHGFNDQEIGIGNGVETSFQLIKSYTDAHNDITRVISKPVAGTLRIALDGVEQLAGWGVDTTTGIVTFATAPGGAVVVTAGFEFDVPVRFGNDDLNINLAYFELSQIPAIQLVEVRV